MSDKKLIGITGGIGAGKSIVCSIIHAMGYPVFYSDKAAHDIFNNNPTVKAGIIDLFGEDAYQQGILNRPFISNKIFNDQNLLSAINGIVHPAVRASFASWAAAQTTSIVFNEAAILFETGAYKLYDANVLVTAPERTRIDRVMKRDTISEDAVRARIAKQWSDSQKLDLADYVITNDKTSMLIPQVIKLLTKLKS